MNDEPQIFLNALILASAALSFVPLHHAQAGPLLNGDFADPVPPVGWTPTGRVVSLPPGAFAQLETDGGYQRTLEQTFTLLQMPARLAFDFAFSTSIPDGTSVPEDQGIFPDSFTVSLYTTDWVYFLDILVVDVVDGAVPDPSHGKEQKVDALPIDVGFDPAFTIAGFERFAGGFSTSGRLSLPLPANVLGQEVTLYFDLYDEPDGAATRAAVDNVAVELAAVPEPATLGLLVIGLAAAGVAHRRTELSPTI